jgi:hypothetical protein
MTTTIVANAVSLQSDGDCCVVTVDGKDDAVQLRQRLVRQGIVCTFPMPTWHRSKFTFRAKYPAGMGHAEFDQMVNDMSDGERSF